MSMAKAKKGDLFSCQVCGLVLVVDEACGCAVGEVICCEVPMKKGKLAAGKARKKAMALPAAKPAAAAAKKGKAKAPAVPAAKAPAKAAAKPKKAAPKAAKSKK
jgi:hypothetical protein